MRKKARKDPEGHGLMTCCNRHRKTSIMKLKDRQRRQRDVEIRDTQTILIDDGIKRKKTYDF